MFTPGLIGWHSQYNRMMRGSERLRRPYRSSTEYDDDLRHFLQDCWHLKDWIKNDPATDIGERIDKEVNANESLRIIGDLATACKHLNHDRRDSRNAGKGAYAIGNDVRVQLGADRPADITYRIEMDDGSVISEKDLIAQALGAWSAVLRKLGLSP